MERPYANLALPANAPAVGHPVREKVGHLRDAVAIDPHDPVLDLEDEIGLAHDAA